MPDADGGGAAFLAGIDLIVALAPVAPVAPTRAGTSFWRCVGPAARATRWVCGACSAAPRDYEVGRIFTTTWSTDEQPHVVDQPVSAWVRWVLDHLMADFPYPYVGVLLPGPGRPATTLRLVGERRDSGTGRPASGATPGQAVSIDGTVCGSVFATGTPALVADVRAHQGYGALADPATRSGLVVPVVRDGRPIAVINVESTRVGGLDITDLERVTNVAAEAAAGAPSEVSDSAA